MPGRAPVSSATAGEAPLDLRVNTLKTDRAAARAVLAEGGIEAAPTPISPVGLRVAGRRALTGSRAYRGGLVEVPTSRVATLAKVELAITNGTNPLV